jgi:hypothetical protein
MMEPYKVDVPVLLIFFCRPQCFQKVFEQVKQARPSKLFLYQDGPRPHKSDDADKVRRCRDIAEDIDWDCEVHRFYQEQNVGCDPSEFISIKWMFEHVDRGIILEDDDVPSQSFFRFCAELLEKYKDDARISKIVGMNHLGIHEGIASDYFFTNVCSIWGWATWKRCTDLWQERLEFLDDEESVEKVKNSYCNKRIAEQFLGTCKWHRASGIAHYESITLAAQRLNDQFNIAPQKNLITSVGFAADSTHGYGTTNWKMLPRAIRKLYGAKRYELEFPLKHPEKVAIEYVFEKYFDKIIHPGRFRSILRQCECEYLNLFCTGSEGRALAKKNLKRRLSRIKKAVANRLGYKDRCE